MPRLTRVATGKSLQRLSKLALAVACSVPFCGAAVADDATIILDLTYSSGAGSAGMWELFGRVDATTSGANGEFGLSAVRALLDDIDFGVEGDAISLASGIGAIDPIDQGGANQRSPAILLGNGTVDLIYGQDLSESNGNLVAPGVGTSGSTMLASGTFSAGMTPGFGQDVSGPATLFTQALFLPSATTPITSGAILADNTYTLVVDNLGLPGDYNLDGTVDAADYTVWRDTENSTSSLAADGNGDLVVDGADYTVWSDNYGSSSSLSTAVPEPTSLVVVSLATLLAAAAKPRQAS